MGVPKTKKEAISLEAKSYSCEPTIYEDTVRGETIWRVRLGTRFLGKGYKPEKYTFKTRKEATAFASTKIQEKQGLHVEARSIKVSEKLLDQAKVVQEMLGKEVSLLEVVTAWQEKIKPFLGCPSVEKAIVELVDFKTAENQSPRHLRELKAKLKRLFRGFEKKKLSDITPQDMEKALKALDARGNPPSATQRVKRLRYAAILFHWGIDKGYCSKLPFAGIARPKVVQAAPRPIGIFEVMRILYVAAIHAPEALPALAIKFFAGLRNSELYKLDWSDVQENSILVSSAVSKTNKARAVTIPDNLKSWLDSLDEDDRFGLVFGMKPRVKDREAVWLDVIKKIEEIAKVKISQNSLRHTFGSYHYHLYKSSDRTAFEMGNSPRVVTDNYVNAVSEAEASAFFSIEHEATIATFDRKRGKKRLEQLKELLPPGVAEELIAQLEAMPPVETLWFSTTKPA